MGGTGQRWARQFLGNLPQPVRRSGSIRHRTAHPGHSDRAPTSGPALVCGRVVVLHWRTSWRLGRWQRLGSHRRRPRRRLPRLPARVGVGHRCCAGRGHPQRRRRSAGRPGWRTGTGKPDGCCSTSMWAARDACPLVPGCNKATPSAIPPVRVASPKALTCTLARKFNGEWIAADGPLPMVLSGWEFHSSDQVYEGTATRGSEERTAWECRDAEFCGIVAD